MDELATTLIMFAEMYPFAGVHVPADDDPIPRLEEQEDKGWGRWGTSYREHWQQHGRPQRLIMSFHGLPRRCISQGPRTAG